MWVWTLVTVQFRIFLSMSSSTNIFHAAHGEFEALFFIALVRAADALKTAARGNRPILVLVSGLQVTRDLVTISKNMRRKIRCIEILQYHTPLAIRPI